MKSTLIEEQALYDIIQKIANSAFAVTRDTDFLSDLKFDSMMSIFLVTTIEDTFGIDIPMDKITCLKTCGELYDVIQGIQCKS